MPFCRSAVPRHVVIVGIPDAMAYFELIFELLEKLGAISVNTVSQKASHISKSKSALAESNKVYVRFIAFTLWKLCSTKEVNFFLGHPVLRFKYYFFTFIFPISTKLHHVSHVWSIIGHNLLNVEQKNRHKKERYTNGYRKHVYRHVCIRLWPSHCIWMVDLFTDKY